MALWLFNPCQCSPAEETARIYTTNATDKADCMRRLNIVWGAIQQYRMRHEDSLPDKLSDLTPDFIHDPNDLICPFVQRRGGLRAWKKQFADLADDPHTSYSYEFPGVPLHYNLWRGLPLKTWRELKQRLVKEVGPVVPIVRCHDHRPWLNLAYDGRIYESQTVYWEQNFVTNDHLLIPAVLFATPASSRPLAATDFPNRNPNADARLLDLTGVYNALLATSWQGSPGNNLAGLPPGIHQFGGVGFDIRGVIQLGGSDVPAAFPRSVEGIKVHRKCTRIHFLHAVSFIYPFGTTNGSYTIHYADGLIQTLPLVYGKQISDWWFNPNDPAEPKDAKVVWTGQNDAAKAHGRAIRLYQFTLENPRKDAEVATISVVANAPADGPFLLAITLD
jgi:hypothetical protein